MSSSMAAAVIEMISRLRAGKETGDCDCEECSVFDNLGLGNHLEKFGDQPIPVIRLDHEKTEILVVMPLGNAGKIASYLSLKAEVEEMRNTASELEAELQGWEEILQGNEDGFSKLCAACQENFMGMVSDIFTILQNLVRSGIENPDQDGLHELQAILEQTGDEKDTLSWFISEIGKEIPSTQILLIKAEILVARTCLQDMLQTKRALLLGSFKEDTEGRIAELTLMEADLTEEEAAMEEVPVVSMTSEEVRNLMVAAQAEKEAVEEPVKA